MGMAATDGQFLLCSQVMADTRGPIAPGEGHIRQCHYA